MALLAFTGPSASVLVTDCFYRIRRALAQQAFFAVSTQAAKRVVRISDLEQPTDGIQRGTIPDRDISFLCIESVSVIEVVGKECLPCSLFALVDAEYKRDADPCTQLVISVVILIGFKASHICCKITVDTAAQRCFFLGIIGRLLRIAHFLRKILHVLQGCIGQRRR